MKILLIDDEQEKINLIQAALEAVGQTVFTAPNGALGLELLLQGEHFDLIVTDYRMRPGNGLLVITAARQNTPPIRVWLITDDLSDPLRQQALRAGAERAFDKNDFVRRIPELFR